MPTACTESVCVILCRLARGAQNREDGQPAGLVCGLPVCSVVQTGLCPPACPYGLPGEGGSSLREERQPGADKGQWVIP